MKPEWKKLLVLNLPYLLFVYLFAKCGQAYRLAAGVDASAKLLHLTNGISVAFADQPHRTDQPALCQRSQCCGIVQPILPAGHQYRHHDIFCRRCIQYSCRLVQRTALDCYRFGTSSSDRLCHLRRCTRWKSDSQSNPGRRFGCRIMQCHLPKRQSGHCRYDK